MYNHPNFLLEVTIGLGLSHLHLMFSLEVARGWGFSYFSPKSSRQSLFFCTTLSALYFSTIHTSATIWNPADCAKCGNQEAPMSPKVVLKCSTTPLLLQRVGEP